MTDEEIFNRLAAELAEGVTALQLGAQDGVKTTLEAVQGRVNQILATQPSDYNEWRLGELQQSVKLALDEAYGRVAEDSADIQFSAWRAGAAVIETPMAAVGYGGVFNALETNTILAMGEFQTQLITNVGQDVVNRINASLAGVVTGMETPLDAMKAINKTLGGGHGMKRAQRIVVTEVGRAFSTATQKRMEDAVAAGARMKKKWRRSGKIYSRVSHDIIDGQYREVDKPFIITGEKVLYPRAPGVSAKNSVNCGCKIIPVAESFDELQPGRRPFNDDEQRLNPTKRDLENELGRPDLPAPSPITKLSSIDDFIAAGHKISSEIAQDISQDDNQLWSIDFRDRLLDKLGAERDLSSPNSITGAMGKQVKEALKVLPSSWHKAAAERGTVHFFQSSNRAYYQELVSSGVHRRRQVKAGDGVVSIDKNNSSVILHEYTHHLQRAMPALQSKFQELHERRTRGETTKPLKLLFRPDEGVIRYPSSERGRRDHYLDVYFGKEYEGGAALEVWTMGVEYLLGTKSWLKPSDFDNADILGYLRKTKAFKQKILYDQDRELLNFIIGVIFHYDP